jgi:hypothetical protein
VRNKTLPAAVMRVGNPGCSPVTIHGENRAPTPTGFAEIVSDDFPVLRVQHSACFADHMAITQ